MTQMRVRVGPGGRVVIPSRFRKELGMKPGDEVVILLERGSLEILTLGQAVERARRIVAGYAGKRSLASELIEQRKGEVSSE